MNRMRDNDMDHRPDFSLAVSQNRYLSTEDDEMHAVLTVTASGAIEAGAAPEVAEVIAIDCSGSMAYPPTTLAAAQRATRAAIDTLRDGALFAVIEGTDVARMVYPTAPGLIAATPDTRRAAKDAVVKLRANGGTAMGKWLKLARQLLAGHPTAVRHVILLTDGKNMEPEGALDRALTACASEFTCDARGLGADWEPRELLRIAAALHGSADAVRQPADLAADFAAMTQSAMDKLFPELRILVKTTSLARLDFLRQTYPTEADLGGVQVEARTTSFTTGSWGAESREYHLRLKVDSAGAELDDFIRVGRVDLELRRPGTTEFETACDPVLVFVHWTDDLKLSSVLDPKVAHYTEQTELGQAVLRGCDAHDSGDLTTAAAEWGRAVALATRLDNDKVLVRLRRLVDVVGDPAQGVVRIKEKLRAVDLVSAAVGSVVSSMSPDASPESAAASTPPTSPDVSCPTCHRTWPAGSVFCGRCGQPLSDGR
jgi:Ca-activated chloride channel family protein